MLMTLKRDWQAFEVSDGKCSDTTIPQGCHEIERVRNPLGYDGYWLVLKGTLIGAGEKSWRQWRGGQISDNPDHQEYGKTIDLKEWEVSIVD